MKNKVWFFGDSFTFGEGCVNEVNGQPHPYLKRHPEGKLWTDIVGDFLNRDKVNLGVSGCSNQHVLEEMVLYLPKIKRDDIVIVGTPIGARYKVYVGHDLNKFLHINQGSFDQTSRKIEITHDESYNKELNGVLEKYLYEYIMPSSYTYESHYTNLIEKILIELNNRGVHTLLWDFNEFGKHERIREVTDIDDYHWSWEGHRTWANKCINKLKNVILKQNVDIDQYIKKQKNLFIFGCSFSSNYNNGYIKEEELYGSLLSKDLGLNLINTASPGYSNDELLYNLCENLPKTEKGDIIIYQFTGFDRVGFKDENGSIFTSTGLAGSDKKFKRDWPWNQFTNDQMDSLLKYIVDWMSYKRDYHLLNPLNILEYLRINKDIKYYLMNMDGGCQKIDTHTVLLPTLENPNNTKMTEFLVRNNLHIGHDAPEILGVNDAHPSIEGHKKLYEIIKNKIYNNE